MTTALALRLLLAATVCLPLASASPPTPDPSADAIIQKSVEANERDWQAAPNYSYTVTTRKANGSITEQVIMIGGSPYHKLIRRNGKPLSAAEQKHEEQKYQNAQARRNGENSSDAAARIAKYDKERHRDHELMQQLTRAFTFRLAGEHLTGGRQVYALIATPRAGYQPPDVETRVLTGMKGELWIDKKTYQWVRVRAEVMSPVSIEGFLATVQPGTFFELEKAPVGDDVWLPKHFRVESQSRILNVFNHATQEDDTFSDYQPARTEPGAGNSPVQQTDVRRVH
jgi:hypothetical protein